jgi:hypothetical protein
MKGVLLTSIKTMDVRLKVSSSLAFMEITSSVSLESGLVSL